MDGRAAGRRDRGCGIDGGWQSFEPTVEERGQEVAVDVAVRTYRYDAMRLAWSLLRDGGPAGVAAGGGCTWSLSVYEFHKGRLVLDEPEDLVGAARALRPIVEGALLPAADECATLDGLDRLMNSPRTASHDYPLDHLIVARLVDSPRYDELYEEMRAQGRIDEDLDWWLSIARERLAARLPSKRDLKLTTRLARGR